MKVMTTMVLMTTITIAMVFTDAYTDDDHVHDDANNYADDNRQGDHHDAEDVDADGYGGDDMVLIRIIMVIMRIPDRPQTKH